MGLNSIIKIFLPKDKVFYSIFEQMGANLIEMGAAFRAAIEEENPTKRIQMLRALEDLEHKNDELTHKIFVELGQNFITPFDREDIHYLATSLDDAIIRLFATKMDAIELVKLKDIYQDMEVITDKCEDAANVIESIIIKYA